VSTSKILSVKKGFAPILIIILVLGVLMLASIPGYVIGKSIGESKNKQSTQTANAPIKPTTPNQAAAESKLTQEKQVSIPPCASVDREEQDSLPTPEISPGHLLYRHLVPDIAIPIYQVEIPEAWAIHDQSDWNKGIYRTNFGDPHFIINPTNEPKITYEGLDNVAIFYMCNPTLAAKDLTNWKSEDFINFGLSEPNGKKYESITVDGITAKKYTVATQGDDSTVVYFTKNGVIFAIIDASDSMLSTFKVVKYPF
jgi:hypothetical protein